MIGFASAGHLLIRFPALILALSLTVIDSTYAVSISLGFGNLKNSSYSVAPAGTLWAIVVAPTNAALPGGLEQDSSLTPEGVSFAKAAFAGVTIKPGIMIGDAVIMKTGQLGVAGVLEEFIEWNSQDYEIIQAGGLIGLYWFPGIVGSTTVVPEGGFEIGGLQETTPLIDTGDSLGMIVPENGSQTYSMFFFDETITGSTSSLPVSRFTAIEVPPSGYQVWRDGTFSPLQIEAGDALPAADPDGDGLANLVEYATGSAPLQPNPGPLGLTASGESLLLEFPRIADPELHYRIEATADLSLSVWPDLIFESTGSDNLEELVQLSQPLSPGQRFFRLRVE